MIPATDRTDTDPSVTSRTTTVRTMSPITSSATAAPSTMRASVVARALRSPNTRAVMPTLVAVSAAPTNSAVLKSSPIRPMAPMPSAIGAITPITCHRHRHAADLAELPQIHLHAHLEQQEDHSDLAERAQDLVVAAHGVDAPRGR